MTLNICFISSNEICREGWTHTLKSEGFEAVESFETTSDVPAGHLDNDHLCILDCPELGRQTIEVDYLKKANPNARIVVISEVFDLKVIIECFNLGSQGYIIKTAKSLPMIMSLRLAAIGEKVVPADLVNAIDHQTFERPTTSEVVHDIEEAKLSPREVDVLCGLMVGFPNKVIARKLKVCEATVKVHVKAILRKLDVNNRTQAAIWGSSHGITEVFQLN